MFDNGHVIESGTFDELVAKGGRFAELARAQFMVQEHARAGAETAKKKSKVNSRESSKESPKESSKENSKENPEENPKPGSAKANT
jgi:hypothetical protein